jgi:hypothetical protein
MAGGFDLHSSFYPKQLKAEMGNEFERDRGFHRSAGHSSWGTNYRPSTFATLEHSLLFHLSYFLTLQPFYPPLVWRTYPLPFPLSSMK